jgi:hypothetical protein
MTGRYASVVSPLRLKIGDGYVSIIPLQNCIAIHHGDFNGRIFEVARSEYLTFDQCPDIAGAYDGKGWQMDKLAALLDQLGAIR